MPWLVARVDGIMVLGTHFWEILGDARVKGINHDESIYEYIYIYIRSYTHIYIHEYKQLLSPGVKQEPIFEES